jgi:hypothetical protein
VTIPDTVTWPPQSHDDLVGMVEMLRRRVLELEQWKHAEFVELTGEPELEESLGGFIPEDALDAANKEFWRKFRGFRDRARKAGGDA